MTAYDQIWPVAEDHYGIITSPKAKELGVSKQNMVAMEKNGRLERIAHGVYQVRHHVPTPNDVYAACVAIAGENAYLRGAMLGYTRKFMDETYPYIIDFSDLKEFEDRPFKQLSSGMKSRLAFSIASLMKPEMLIIDEVLSVGDGAFRIKSEAKMREIIANGATTILVTHSVGQVRSMCNKVLWLDKGLQIAFTDDVQGVCDAYESYLSGRASRPEYLPQ